MEHLLDRQDNLRDMLSREKNRLMSSQYHVKPHEVVYDDLRESISSLEHRIEKIQEVINDHLDAHPHLKEQKKLLLSVPGVGDKSVLYILITMHRWGAFTDGEGDANGIVALLGLDPKTHESGTSVRKRGRISRQGDRSQRSRLYMCALGGVRGDNPLRAFYSRLVGRGKPKKVALVAAARKIVVWCWAVFRSNAPFDTARFDYSQ
jgi:transposase